MDKAKIDRGFQKIQRQQEDWDDIYAAVEEIQRVGGLKKAATQAETASSQAEAHLETAKKNFSTATDQLKTIQKRIDESRSEAQTIIKNAQIEAETIVKRAREEASQTAKKAQEKIKGLEEQALAADAAAAEAQRKLADFNNRIAAVREESQTLASRLVGVKQ